MSQKDLAARVKVDPSTLAKWEREERVPVGKFLSRIQDFVRASAANRHSAARGNQRDRCQPSAVTARCIPEERTVDLRVALKRIRQQP